MPYYKYEVNDDDSQQQVIRLRYNDTYSFTPDYIFMKVVYQKDGRTYTNFQTQYVYSVFDQDATTNNEEPQQSAPAFTTVPTNIIISEINPKETLPAINTHTEQISADNINFGDLSDVLEFSLD